LTNTKMSLIFQCSPINWAILFTCSKFESFSLFKVKKFLKL